MSQMSKVPTLTNLAGVLLTIHELSLLLMLQIPKLPTITGMVHVPHHSDHRGDRKDLNDLARMVTVIEGRQPPTIQGDGGGLFKAKENADSFGRKHTHHTTGGAGGKCPAHDPRRVVVLNVADPQNANHHKDGAYTPPPKPQGGGERSE